MRRGVLVSVAAVGLVVACITGALFADRAGAICLTVGAPGPATSATGPVGISTNQTVYQPYDMVVATVTNELARPFWLVPPQAFVGWHVDWDCPKYLFREQDGRWEPDFAASGCAFSAPGNFIPFRYAKLVAGGSVPVRFGGYGFMLSPGTYRVSYRYVLQDPTPLSRYPYNMPDPLNGAPSSNSEPFHVCICGRCA